MANTIIYIHGQVAVGDRSAVDRNGDAACGGQHQILVRQLCARGIGPSKGDIHFVHRSGEVGGIVAWLRVGIRNHATTTFEEINGS